MALTRFYSDFNRIFLSAFVVLFFKIPESSWNAHVIALTQTWLKDHDLNQDFEIDGFGQLYRLDRYAQITSKSLGRDVCLYVNSCWCKTVKVRESMCSSHNEFLSVSLCPFYLPREIPQVFLTVVYMHPQANMAEAASSISTSPIFTSM